MHFCIILSLVKTIKVNFKNYKLFFLTPLAFVIVLHLSLNFCSDETGYFWIVTSKGMLCFDAQRETYIKPYFHDSENPQSLSHNFVTSIVPDPRERERFLRIITSGGVPNRLKKAVQLLEQKYGTVAEIAYRVSFGDPSYFTRCFCQQFGVSPSDYAAI